MTEEIEYKNDGKHVLVIDRRDGVARKYWIPKSQLVNPTGLVKTRTVLSGGATTKTPPGAEAPVRSAVQQHVHSMPGLSRRAFNFSHAFRAHLRAGNKNVGLEVIQDRWAKCNLCPSLVRKDQHTGMCSELACGCYLADDQRMPNKLAWAEQKCPLKKWWAVDG